jgi:GAF domain-containing protein
VSVYNQRDPEQEAICLAANSRYEIFDSPPEEPFDRIVSIVASLFGTSLAAITLVDTDRSFHKAEIGFGLMEMPRTDEMCDRVISRDDILIINDALQSPRELVRPMLNVGLRFYVGAPLTTYDGIKIGMPCAVDPEPKDVRESQARILEQLAAVVIDEMELRLAVRRMVEAGLSLHSLNQRLEASNRNKSLPAAGSGGSAAWGPWRSALLLIDLGGMVSFTARHRRQKVTRPGHGGGLRAAPSI